MVAPGLRTARLVILSERRLVREALAAYFANGRGFTVVGHTGTAHGLETLCALGRPDVALIDVNALTTRVVGALRDIRGSFPATDLVVAYTNLSLELLAEAVRAGVTAFVPSSRGLEAVLRQLRQRARRVSARPGTPAADGQALTDRELGIISLLSSGHTASDIARLLGISPHTVDNHKRRVFAKFGVDSQSMAVSRAMALGLVSPVPQAGQVRAAEPGRAPLAVVYGTAGVGMDLVLRTLVSSGIPFVHARAPQQLHEGHWAQWQAGPIIAVLVDPAGPEWVRPARVDTAAVVVWSTLPDRLLVAETLTAGARALMSGDDVPEDLPLVLSLVARGYLAVSAGHQAELAGWLAPRDGGYRAGMPELTAREQEVLGLMAGGHTIRQTARVLGIAAKTVENTQARLYRKLGTHNRAETLAVAYRLGLIEPADWSTPVRS